MTLQAWGSAALLIAAALAVGRAMTSLSGSDSAAGPGAGLAALVVVAAITIQLPGRAMTAAIILLVVALAAGVFVAAKGLHRPLALPRLIAAAVAAAGAGIPFIANGRTGMPGVSLDNDTAMHLLWAEGLRSPGVARRYGLPSGYPLGPHSLIDALATGVGMRLDLALTGLLIATVVLTAIVAAGAIRDVAAWKRVLTGVLAALFYLPAAYYAEASFKETILGLLLLSLVVQLNAVRRAWRAGVSTRFLSLAPVSILVAGSIYVYSYLALAWMLGTVVVWLAAELVTRPRWALHSGRDLIQMLAAGGAWVVATVILLLPSVERIFEFASQIGTSPAATGAITVSNVGNLPGALSTYESLGIWNSYDFRFAPASVFHAGELAAFALAVLVVGIGVLIARREFVAPAAICVCALVFWRASHGQSPYVSAKALVIPGPLVAVSGMAGLFLPARSSVSRWITVPRLVLALVFAGFALHSSYQALRDEPVAAPESTRELLQLATLTRGSTLLFLGNSDYAPWLFHTARMSALAQNTLSMAQAAVRPSKPNAYGTALDFDSIDPASVNRFTWLITTNTTYASQVPAGFRLVRSLRMYQLWRRVRYVAGRLALEPSGAPGAVLDCKTSRGRMISRQHGLAAIMPTPVLAGLTGILPGETGTARLQLPHGRWDISLQYTSAVPVRVSAAGHAWSMPAYVDRPGPFFEVGNLASSGRPIVVTVRALKPSAITGPILAGLPTAIAAVRSPARRTLVPLSRACGRYVDWYQVASR